VQDERMKPPDKQSEPGMVVTGGRQFSGGGPKADDANPTNR
jgi:hypothetical protein